MLRPSRIHAASVHRNVAPCRVDDDGIAPDDPYPDGVTQVVLLLDWLDPENMIRAFGAFAVLGVCAVVIAETGLLAGFFLPGDSLLFTAGLLTAAGVIRTPIAVVALAIGVAAFVGDQMGYGIGRKGGPRVFNRPDSRFFKQEYVERTHEFYERHGGRAVILARFVPIVRTFAPVMAGVAGMPYRRYVVYDVVGAILWGIGVTLLGYWLGGFAFVTDNIEVILIGIVAVSVIPVGLEFLRARRQPKAVPVAVTEEV
jgi:membrane-associated protein